MIIEIRNRQTHGGIEMVREMVDLERKITELAGQVLDGSRLGSFLDLPLKSKIIGIAVFAQVGNDPAVVAQMMKALKLYFAD